MNMLNGIVGSIRERWEKERQLLNYVYDKVDKGEIPCFIYKHGSEYNYRPLIDIASNYNPHRGIGKCMVIGSTGYSFKHNTMKRIDRDSLKKVRAMDMKIIELQKERQKLLKQAWLKNKKLTWQFAEEWDEERNRLLVEYGLKEDK